MPAYHADAVTHPPTESARPGVLADYLTPEDLAAQLGTSTRSLARWRGRRTGPPYVQLGRRVMYHRASVETWLRAREQGAPRRTR